LTSTKKLKFLGLITDKRDPPGRGGSLCINPMFIT